MPFGYHGNLQMRVYSMYIYIYTYSHIDRLLMRMHSHQFVNSWSQIHHPCSPSFWMMEENTAISTPRQNSSNAEGTTRLTKRVPSASNLTLQVTKQPASQQIQQNEQNMQKNTTTDAVQMKGFNIWFVSVRFCRVKKKVLFSAAALRAEGSQLWFCQLPWSFASHHFRLLPRFVGSPR